MSQAIYVFHVYKTYFSHKITIPIVLDGPQYIAICLIICIKYKRLYFEETSGRTGTGLDTGRYIDI